MHALIVAGILALAGAQTNIEPSVLDGIFGTSTRQPLEEVRPVDQNILDIVFGPTTPNRSGTTKSIEEVPRNTTRLVKVDGLPTIKPSLLTEVFGTPLKPKSSRLTREDTSPKKNTQGTRDVKAEGVPSIKPSLLTEVFGTPPTPDSSRQRNQGASPNSVTQGTRVVGVPTVKPLLLTEVFGTPPTPDSSRQQYEDKNSLEVTQRTRNVNVEGVPAVDPSILIDIFGTPPTTNSSKHRLEDITVKPTEGTSTFVDKEGQKCQCVPYYLCDANNVGVDVNNARFTGFATLDIRFGEDDNEIKRKCQESVEVCCVIPKDPTTATEAPKPLPTPEPVKGCGYRNPKGLGVTITGGTGAESQFGEFPWVVALLDNRDSSYAGVGVLIHPQVVMTGAHVVQKYGSLKIRAGEWDTQTVKEIYSFEERNVGTTIIHENFMSKSLNNDIALLLLDIPLKISEHINVICMPDQEEVFDSSKNCVANGWGKSNFGQSNRYAVILKKVEVDMVPYSRCNTLLKRTRLGHNFKLHNSFVCAGGEAGKDTCQGDGGAPLACPIGNNRYKLTGLVSWGIGCGKQDIPAVYTNVPHFRDWVDDKMAQWGLEATSYRISK